MKIENMKNIRKDRGLTQRELARRMGTSQARVSSIETGLNVSPKLAQRYADCLMCDVSELRTPDQPTVTFRLSDLPPELAKFISK